MKQAPAALRLLVVKRGQWIGRATAFVPRRARTPAARGARDSQNQKPPARRQGV